MNKNSQYSKVLEITILILTLKNASIAKFKQNFRFLKNALAGC